VWTYLRIAGGILFLIALFLRPLRWRGSNDSAFQLAAQWNSPEAIAVFFASVAVGLVATISSFFTRRAVEWVEMLLTVAGVGGIVFFVWRFGTTDRDGVALTWAGLMLVGGLGLIALGANGRYRNADRE